MFESYKQVGAQNMDTTALTNCNHFIKIVWGGYDPCHVRNRLRLSEQGGALGRATFKHLIIAGELHDY